MLIKTTAHLNILVINKVLAASKKLGIPRHALISSLLKIYASNNISKSVQWKRIKYQKRDAMESWKRLHLLINPDEYEFFLDLRKVFKKSLSACIAEAVNEYLELFLSNMKKSVDNYRYRNYSFARIIIDDVICWISSWGLPRKPLTHFFLE